MWALSIQKFKRNGKDLLYGEGREKKERNPRRIRGRSPKRGKGSWWYCYHAIGCRNKEEGNLEGQVEDRRGGKWQKFFPFRGVGKAANKENWADLIMIGLS